MIYTITQVLDENKLFYKSRVQLKEAEKQISDIDLLVWSDVSNAVLLISLKWFYGPDSVQEVSNHSKRYREANTQQRRIFEYSNTHKSELLNRWGIMNKNIEVTTFLPLIIYEEDMPLEQDRESDFPAVKISRFIQQVERKKYNIHEIYEKLSCEYGSYPAKEYKIERFEYNIGEFVFSIPSIQINNGKTYE